MIKKQLTDNILEFRFRIARKELRIEVDHDQPSVGSYSPQHGVRHIP